MVQGPGPGTCLGGGCVHTLTLFLCQVDDILGEGSDDSDNEKRRPEEERKERPPPREPQATPEATPSSERTRAGSRGPR